MRRMEMEMEDAECTSLLGGGGTFSITNELHCLDVGEDHCKSVWFIPD